MPIVCLIVLLLAIGVPAGALAQQAGRIAEADRLCQAGQYAQAEAAYKQIVQENLGTDTALAAQRGLAVLYAKTGKEALLSQTCESLTKDFGGHKDMPSILGQIADECRNANRFGMAVPIYQYVVDHWPGDENAMISQANLVCCQLCLKNESAANTAFAKLQSDYSSRPNLRQVLCTIGDNLRWRNINPQAARQMYTLAASGDPYPEMISARIGLAISCIRMKDFEAARPVIESIAADYGSSARIGEAMCHIADAYRDIRSHGDARQLYQYVIEHYPNDEYAMWSQAGVAISAIDSKDEQIAQAAIEKLRANHASRPDFAAAVCVVADNYRWREGFAKAKDLYALAVAASPSHSQSIWFQMGLAICSICVNDPNTAQAAIAKLHSQYRSDPGLVQALYEVGATFGNAKQYDKATAELNQVITTWPDSDYAMLSKVGLGLIQVRRGDDKAAEVIYQKILADYAGHPRLPEAINFMTEGYYSRALELETANRNAASPQMPPMQREVPQQVKEAFGRAIEKWSIILQQFPDTPNLAPTALYFSAVSYSRQDDPAKAIECYQAFVERWPDDERNHHVLLRLPGLYKQLVFKGVLSEEQASPLIRGAYERFVQKYPDSPAAEMARQQILYYATPVEAQTHEQ
jgi:TolA-binding protein